MATLILAFNTSNSIPTAGDPLHNRSFTATHIDDLEIVEQSVDYPMLNQSKEKSVLGIYRNAKLFLRPSDIQNNLDFIYAFINSAYRWILTPDSGNYFNLGTIDSPVAVPVQMLNKEQSCNVIELITNGLQVMTKDIYQRPTAPTGSGLVSATTVISIDTNRLLKFRVYRSNSSGGILSYMGESAGVSFTDSGGASNYYKITTIGIGGESEYSAEFYPIVAL
ncbi:MAG: hypothetical protein WCW35_14675 [Bacteroidota bacterium]|jgi:hypothetical protein